MFTIKFSHFYPKLWRQTEAKLIHIELLDSSKLSNPLIEYDTKDINSEYYKLPKGKLIQLIFLGNSGIPFCTIRSHNKQKEGYYRRQIGQTFRIKIDTKEKET